VAFQDVVRKKSRDGRVSFIAPCYYHLSKSDPKTKMLKTQLLSLVVPVSPGKCRIIFKAMALPSKVPKWLMHIAGGKFLDSDVWVHHCEQRLRSRYTNSFAFDQREDRQLRVENYVMPTTSDLAVRGFRAWWAKHMSLSPVFGVNVNPPGMPIEAQLDRYETHTKRCSVCLDVLSRATTIKAWSPLIVLFVMAVIRSIPVRLAAVVVYGLANNLADKIIRGVKGPERGSKVSSAKMFPE
jgi:hypothetical protein